MLLIVIKCKCLLRFVKRVIVFSVYVYLRVCCVRHGLRVCRKRVYYGQVIQLSGQQYQENLDQTGVLEGISEQDYESRLLT
jgi:hypothetical protein